MNEIKGELNNNQVTLFLSGHIDSGNAAAVEQEVQQIITEDAKTLPVLIDAQDLQYISSAGLRIILRLRKTNANIHIINACPEVYEILDMTGFTQMMQIDKAYRVVSVEGCEVIGQGANGTIYRIDKDNVVKVYNNANALEEIQHEREVARLALVLGIPTAISYDVVRVGDSYGSVFELLDAKSFSKILATQPERMDWCVEEYVDMLKKIHRTLVPKGDLPDIRETALGWARFMQDYLPEEYGQKLLSLVEAVPQDDHMIHGDYHTKNLELTGDEVLLIDMDTLAVGHPVFELASMYNAFIGFSEYDNNTIKEFQGFDLETSKTFWNKVLCAYLNTHDEETIRSIEDKARIVGYTRMIRRSIRRQGLETEDGRAEIKLWTDELLELLDRTDSLYFDRNGITVEAKVSNLHKIMDFVEGRLQKTGCPMNVIMQINVAVEEIFTNVSSYAYVPGTGNVTVGVYTDDDNSEITIKFIDSGQPYNPLAKEDPDITLPAEDRQIGGLGIYLVKQVMDEVKYEYKEGCNVLELKKYLNEN